MAMSEWENEKKGGDVADVKYTPADSENGTLANYTSSIFTETTVNGGTRMRKPSHIARASPQSITQKSLLAFGFKKNKPWVTLELFDAGTGLYPAYTDNSIIRGAITLSSPEEESLEEISIAFRGWTPSLGQKSKHDILWVPMKLELPVELNLETGKLPPGTYKIPFKMPSIPYTYTAGNGAVYPLPPSFVLNGFAGFVQYQFDVSVYRKAKLGVEAKVSQVVAYIPRTRSASPSPIALNALRVGRIRPGPSEDPEGWDVRSLSLANGTTLEIALAMPMVYVRNQPITYLVRSSGAGGTLPVHQVELQQIATVGEDATIGAGWEERKITFMRPLGFGSKVGAAEEDLRMAGEMDGWVIRELSFPAESKPNFTFPNFSLGYRIAVFQGNHTSGPIAPPTGQFINGMTSGNNSDSSSALYILVALCTHSFSTGAEFHSDLPKSQSRTRAAVANQGIRTVTSPEEAGAVPQPPEGMEQGAKRMMGLAGPKRVVPRVGPSDWEPVGSVSG